MADRNRALETYRFFGVDGEDGVLWDLCIDCSDDDEARATAMTLSGPGVRIEIWEVARFVDSRPLSPQAH
jgi:hypothetical protein